MIGSGVATAVDLLPVSIRRSERRRRHREERICAVVLQLRSRLHPLEHAGDVQVPEGSVQTGGVRDRSVPRVEGGLGSAPYYRHQGDIHGAADRQGGFRPMSSARRLGSAPPGGSPSASSGRLHRATHTVAARRLSRAQPSRRTRISISPTPMSTCHSILSPPGSRQTTLQWPGIA